MNSYFKIPLLTKEGHGRVSVSIVVVVMVILLFISAYYWHISLSPSTKLQEIHLCKKIYSTNHLEFHGVDFMQRIAELSKDDDSLCNDSLINIPSKNLRSTYRTEDDNSVLVAFYDNANEEQKTSPFSKPFNIFTLTPETAIYHKTGPERPWRILGMLLKEDEQNIREDIDQTKLKTYVNKKYGFSFNYPENLYFYDENLEEGGVLVLRILSPNDPRNASGIGLTTRLLVYIETEEEAREFLDRIRKNYDEDKIIEDTFVTNEKNITTIQYYSPYGVSFIDTIIQLRNGYVTRIEHVQRSKYDDVYSGVVDSFRIIK